MKQLTIRGFDQELERRLRQVARERDVSLNRAALTLMRRGAGISHAQESSPTVGAALDRFIGVWTEKEEAEFLKAVEPFEQIDHELWS